MTAGDHRLMLSTCPDEDSARRIAEALVSAGHAACVNIVPAAHSVYRWQGKVESAQEHLLLIKAPARNLADIERCLRSLHPYEVPELIALPIVGGLGDYLAWLDQPDTTS